MHGRGFHQAQFCNLQPRYCYRGAALRNRFQPDMSSRFLPYILNLRGIAILIVVAVHARGNALSWDAHTGAHTLMSALFDSREGTGTVMFIFIGGFLFQYLSTRGFEFPKYLEKKFLYVILPYVLISIPIIAYRIYTNYTLGLPAGFNDQNAFYRFGYYLFTGLHLAPFWFISTIVLFYLSAPIFRALDRPSAYRYIFPLLILTSFFTYRSEHNANPLLAYIHYFPVYYLGMWTASHRNTILSLGNRLLIPLLVVYVGINVGYLTGAIPTPEKVSFEDILAAPRLIFNIDLLKALTLCYIAMLVLCKFSSKRMIFLEVLGEYSFGIYFVHCIVIYPSQNAWAKLAGDVQYSVISFLLYLAFILVVSILSVYLVKRLTGRYSRILIGS